MWIDECSELWQDKGVAHGGLLMAKKKVKTKTEFKEKVALWLDNDALAALRLYEEQVGVPVSESVRRAVVAYVAELRRKKALV